MSTMSPMPKDHPTIIAWERYKQTEEFANTKFWASKPEHVDGSLWAAFLRGQQDALQSQEQELTRLRQAIAELKRRVLAVIQKRADDYDSENGFTDPATGTREYPKGGDEYMAELAEIKEAIDNAMTNENDR